jgi:hypothetical protein
MNLDIHYPFAYFYADTYEGECTFELSVDEDNDLNVTICTVVAYRTDLEIELEHVLTDYDLQLIASRDIRRLVELKFTRRSYTRRI